jgi:hypothetical protein
MIWHSENRRECLEEVFVASATVETVAFGTSVFGAAAPMVTGGSMN